MCVWNRKKLGASGCWWVSRVLNHHPKPSITSKLIPRSMKRRPTVAGCFLGTVLGHSPPGTLVWGCWSTGSRGGPLPWPHFYTGFHVSSPLAHKSWNTGGDGNNNNSNAICMLVSNDFQVLKEIHLVLVVKT